MSVSCRCWEHRKRVNACCHVHGVLTEVETGGSPWLNHEDIQDEMEHAEDEEGVHSVHQHLIDVPFCLLLVHELHCLTVRVDGVDAVEVVDLANL